MASNARPHLRRTLLALAACGAISGTTQAATVVWSGIGMNDQWMPTALGPAVASNWLRNGVAAGPQNGDDLLFNSNVRTVSTNDYAALQVQHIVFEDGAAPFTFNGNRLTVSGHIWNSSRNANHFGMRLVATGSGVTWFADYLDGGLEVEDGADVQVVGTSIDQGSDSLVVGRSGASTLRLGYATQLKADSITIGASGGAAAGTSLMTLDGHMAGSTSTVTAGSRVVVGQKAPGSFKTQAFSQLHSPYVILAEGAGISGIASVEGSSAEWQVSDTLEVGRAGAASLGISGQGQVEATRAVLAAQPTGSATVTVSGAGSRFGVARDLYVGFQNDATLSVLDGAALDSTTAYLGWTPGSRGTVRVAGGGATWRASTVTLGADGDGTLTLEGGGKGVFGELAIHSRGTVVLGGGRLETGTVQMRGGLLRGSGGLDLDVIGDVRGHGVVDGAVQRGASRLIAAEGGTLTLGDVRFDDGFAFDGTLDVSGVKVVLHDAGTAALGHTTTLRDAGVLQADNGVALGAGRLLQSIGDAQVRGRLVNDGAIRASGGQLSFMDTVDGHGSFAGELRFVAGLDTSGGAQTLHFGDGIVSFASGSLLVVDLVDAIAPDGHDRLSDIQQLVFNGQLRLDFDVGFGAPEGGRFQLFDFASFQGSFDPGRIEVTGFDRDRLDFSRLGVDGSLAIAPVPEPGSPALWIAGLGAMGFVVRRRLPMARGRTEGVPA